MIEMVVATLWQPEWSRCVRSWCATAEGMLTINVISGQRILNAYEQGSMMAFEPVLGFVHDDVVIHENGWDSRVLHQFRDPKVAMVGFGGALGHGHPDLYKTNGLHIPNMARQNFRSNMRSADQHVERFNGACDVAVLDGFAVFIRKRFLDDIGGWPQDGRVSYFMYTEFMCLMARRHGWKVRIVGVDCEHLGGRSSGIKQDQPFEYDKEHHFIAEEFKDVLPWRVG
jgi:GT2 family glycosyltransferase